MKRYTITIDSYNQYNHLEWTKTVYSTTRSGAVRKANSVLKSCCCDQEDVKNKRLNAYNPNHEYWSLT